MADHRNFTIRWWHGVAVALVAATLVFTVWIAMVPQKQADQGTARTVDPRILALPYVNALPLEDGPTQVGVVTHESARSFAGYNIFCSEDDDTLRVLDMAGREVHRIVVPDAKCLFLELYGDELKDPALGFDFDDPRGINRLLDVYSERVREIAREEQVPLVDVSKRFEAYDRIPGQSISDILLPNDDIHPNDAGHALIAKWLTEILMADLVGN